jgi:SAM-dependent methyltransferase
LAVTQQERLAEQHRVWEGWAQADPLWAILSDETTKGGKWDIAEFFASGERDIHALLVELAEAGIKVPRGRCLDFGCGVGRLTQALGAEFAEAHGVDISPTMVELARRYNQRGDRCHYHANVEPNLALFADDTFDLIFSTMVLQHIPPAEMATYISEFVRVLSPGGVAVFDLTADLNRVRLPEGSHLASMCLTRAVPALQVGQEFTVELMVTNTSKQSWPAGALVRAGNYWLDAASGEMRVRDDGRAPLPSAAPAGATVRVSVPITAPSAPGNYRLAFDLVEEGVAWFTQLGSAPAEQTVAVRTASWRERATSLRRRRKRDNIEEPQLTTPYSMYGMPRHDVESTVADANGRIVAVHPSECAGPEWVAYRYVVTVD